MKKIRPLFAQVTHRGDEPHLFREIVRTHQVMMASFTRVVGMPSSRLALMRTLATAEEEIGTMELARRLGINAAAVTRQLNDMQKDGLIRRRTDRGDGRRVYVDLSPKGRELLSRIHDRTHDLERDLTIVISREEMATATKVLEMLRGFIEGLR